MCSICHEINEDAEDKKDCRLCHTILALEEENPPLFEYMVHKEQ